MQRLEVSGAVRLIYKSLGVKGLMYVMQHIVASSNSIMYIKSLQRIVVIDCPIPLFMCYFINTWLLPKLYPKVQLLKFL